ncbi:MAG: hypothetical protein ACRC5H_02730, partial [Treponemataceae bacterium]
MTLIESALSLGTSGGEIQFAGFVEVSSPDTLTIQRSAILMTNAIIKADVIVLDTLKIIDSDSKFLTVDGQACIKGEVTLSLENADLTFTSTVDGVSAGAGDLICSTTNDKMTIFDANVGNINALHSVDITNTTNIAGSIIKTTGNQSYKGNIDFTSSETPSLTLQATTASALILFSHDATITGSTLQVSTSSVLNGDITFACDEVEFIGTIAVAGGATMSQLTVNGISTIHNNITTTLDQRFKGKVTLDTTETKLLKFTTTTTVFFEKELEGNRNIHIVGMADFGDDVTLTSLIIDKETTVSKLDDAIITTQKHQDYNGNIQTESGITFVVTEARNLDVSNVEGDRGPKDKNAVYFNFVAFVAKGNTLFDADLQLRQNVAFSTNAGNLTFEKWLDANRHNIVFASNIGVGQITFNDIYRLGDGEDYCLVIEKDITTAVEFLKTVSGYNGFFVGENSQANFHDNVTLLDGKFYNFFYGHLNANTTDFIWSSSNSVIFDADINSDNKVTINSNKVGATVRDTENNIVFGTKVKVKVDTLTINTVSDNSGYFRIQEGANADISTFVQTGNGLNQLAGTLIITKGSFAADAYIDGETTITTDDLLFEKNMFIDANTKTVIFDNLRVAQNLAIFAGNVQARADFSVDKDLVLLKGNPSDMYNDSVAGQSGVLNLFMYNHSGRQGNTAAPNLSAFPTAFPNKDLMSAAYTTTIDLATYKLSIGGNFYDNGVDLSNCTIIIPANDSALDAFAEAYHATFTSVIVQSKDDTKEAFISAAESCTDGADNINIGFLRPLIHKNDKTLEKFIALSGTYTIFDDIIRLELGYEGLAETVVIENSNDEISKALSNIKFHNGTLAFSGIFTDPECTESTNGKGDITTGVIYLRTNKTAAQRWNTDATGISKGHADSFDRGRRNSSGKIEFGHRDIVPNIEIPKALNALYQTLRDKYKNRIMHYSGSARFNAVEDRCSPTAMAVRTGQEQHRRTLDGEQSANVQRPYDAHNFIEIQYTEPMRFGAGSPLWDGKNLKSQENFAAYDQHGGAINEVGDQGIEVVGYFTSEYGRLKTGSRANPAGDTTVHSLYKIFSPSGVNENEKEYPARIRIGIASYVTSIITVNEIETFNWEGFIDEAVLPRGVAYFVPNEFLCDASGATDIGNAIVPPAHGDVVINNSIEIGTMYGGWDASPPTIAKYLPRREDFSLTWDDGASTNSHEIVPLEKDRTTGWVNAMEFHFFDNSPRYDGSDEEPYGKYKWVSRHGWINQSLPNEGFIPAAEDRGSSRPFNEQTVGLGERTRGGIRASSLIGLNTALSFRLKTSGSVPHFFSEKYLQPIQLPYFFQNQQAPAPDIPPIDGLYLSVFLKDGSDGGEDETQKFFLNSIFLITYDEDKGYITDLAGNRLKTVVDAEIINRTPPAFRMSVAAVKGKEIFLLFDRKMATKYEILGNSYDLLATMPSELVIVDTRKLPEFDAEAADDYWYDAIVEGLIDTSIAARIEKDSEHATGVILTLTREVSIEDILFYNIRVKKPTERRPDPITGQWDFIPLIIDASDNPMYYYREDIEDATKSEYVLSDFAVNFVDALYAYTGIIAEDDIDNVSGALRIFDGTQALGNNKNFILATRLQALGTEVLPDFGKVSLFIGINPTEGSVSTIYNGVTGSNQMVWLPTVFNPISNIANTNDVKVLSQDKISKDLRNFFVPNSGYNWANNEMVEFLFEYENPDEKIYPRMDLFRKNIYALR